MLKCYANMFVLVDAEKAIECEKSHQHANK